MTPTVLCKICSKREKANFLPPIQQRMVEQNLCYVCLSWTEIIADDEESLVVIDQKAFLIHDEKAIGMRGYGGKRFTIVFNDGRVVETTNLWSKGNVPEHFSHILPNNAQFAPDDYTSIPETANVHSV